MKLNNSKQKFSKNYLEPSLDAQYLISGMWLIPQTLELLPPPPTLLFFWFGPKWGFDKFCDLQLLLEEIPCIMKICVLPKCKLRTFSIRITAELYRLLSWVNGMGNQRLGNILWHWNTLLVLIWARKFNIGLTPLWFCMT